MLRVQHVKRAYGDNPVLRGVDLEVAQGEIVCLLGASGCGKTTLLRIIAGLERADSGDIVLDGRSIMQAAVHERGFGLMFQDFALFPHLNVADNVRFGLRMQGVHADEMAARVDSVLALVGLTGFAQMDVGDLSGGERQRVALARSLAPSPRLLMLDEPLGSLDAALRERLVIELREVIKTVGLTALYVTHDQAEAFVIADRIAVMNAGQFEQIDTPENLYRRPKTAYVAQFLGFKNIVNVAELPAGFAEKLAVSADARQILLHPDGITITDDNAFDDSAVLVRGVVRQRLFRGTDYQLIVEIEGDQLLYFDASSWGHVPDVGDSLTVRIARDSIMTLA